MKKGNVIGGTYRLRKRLGRGCQGEVWKATHLDLQSACAVKIITGKGHSSEYNNKTVKDYLKEARTLAKIRDSNYVVKIYDAGTDDETGHAFIAMELLKGMTLEKKKFKKNDELITLGMGVLGGLEELHKNGIIHCDLKPSNIEASNQYYPIIMDFGWSIESGKEEFQDGSVLYRAPEVIMGEACSKSDVWAWGIVMHYAKARYLQEQGEEVPAYPFESDVKDWKKISETERQKQVEILEERILNSEPYKFKDENDPLTIGINYALEKDPDARPTAKELKDIIWEKENGKPEAMMKKVFACSCAALGFSFLAGGGLVYLLIK